MKNTIRHSHSEACQKRLEKGLECTDRSTKAKQREHKLFEDTLKNDDVRMKKDNVDDHEDVHE